jgi:hypothetical protein
MQSDFMPAIGGQHVRGLPRQGRDKFTRGSDRLPFLLVLVLLVAALAEEALELAGEGVGGGEAAFLV